MKREIRWWQALALFILIAGIVLTLWSAQLQDQSMRKDLLIKTSIAKAGVSIEHLEALSGSPADLASPEYQALKNQLEKIRAADPGVRFAYLMGSGQDGTIFIYADSEPPGSAGYSPPGQGYTEAPAVIRSVFATGRAANEGPYTDRWGTWVSEFIPVTDPGTGRMIAVFGMDVDAMDWNAAIAQACAAIITASLLILVLVIVSGLTRERGRREQHHLETSEEKFSRVFHANPALMVVSTIEEGQILDVNTSFLETLGYSRQEVLWKTTSDLGLYFDPEKRDAIISQLKEKGWVRNMDLEIYRKDHALLYGSLSAITIDVAGTPRLLTVIVDYTERKQAEDAFRLKEKKYRLLIDNSHDVIYTLNTEGLFTFISPSWTVLLGHPVTQVIGKPFLQFVHPDDSPGCLAFMQMVIKEGQRQTGIEYRVKHANGSWRWHTTNAVPIRDESGTIVGGEGSASDITRRKEAEKALKESEEEFRGIFDTVNDGVQVHEIEPDGTPGKFIRVNEVTCRMLQYTREELLEHGPLDYVTGYHSRPLREILGELSSTGHSIFETKHRRKDGTTVPVEINAHLVSLGGKRVIVSVVRDITERKVAEEALKRQAATLSILNEVISMAGRADDMDGLLASILTESLHLLDFDAGGIYLVNRCTGTADIVTSKNLPVLFLEKNRTVPIDTSLYTTLFIKNEPVFTDNYAQVGPGNPVYSGFTSVACVPLLSKGVAIGALNIASTKRREISADEKQVLISIGRELGSTIERMAAEAEVIKASKNLEAMVDSIDEMIFVLDTQVRILTVNGTVLKRLRYTPGELTGTDLLLLYVPGQRDEARRSIDEMIAGTAGPCTVPVRAKDGTRIEVETRVTRGWWNNQEVLIGVSRDVTACRRAEELLRQADRKAHLLSTITRHDISDQLTVLMGYLSILEDMPPGPTYNGYFQEVLAAAGRISAMVRFTSEYEEIGATAPAWQDCRTLVDTAARKVQLGTVTVENDLPPGMELFADPLVTMAWYNLVDNAVRYGGKITTIRFSAAGSGDNHIIVCEDDGNGIPAGEKEKIFGRGFEKNTGTGLALSREILGITGITITETGEPGKGARFLVVVPKGMWRTAGNTM